jgi:formylmethanofuran dehydrogenase subunit C
LRVDLRGITPTALTGLSAKEVGRLEVGCGNALVPLAEFFDVRAASKHDALVFEGDLARFDRIGWQMSAGRIEVHGSAGHYAGGCMSGGDLKIDGNAGDLAACEMAGGTLVIAGNAGHFAASTLPGSMDGMRGGTFIVKGHAGDRFGDRMRRGAAIVFGDVGDFLASRMVAGTIAVGGRTGAHAGYAMRRGSIVFAGMPASSHTAPTFTPAIAPAEVIWQLMARDLQRHGGPFAGLASRATERRLGDLSVEGKGELVFVR